MNEVGGGIVCPQCGVANMSMSAFCHACGLSLRQAGTPVARDPRMQPPGLAPSAPPHEPFPPPSPYPTHPSYPHNSIPTTPGPQYPTSAGAPYSYAAVPSYGQPPMPYANAIPASGGYASDPPPAAYGVYGQPLSININPMINMQAAYPMQPPSQPLVVVQNAEVPPSLLVRALWFLFFGVWLGFFATLIGWLLCVMVITLPVGLLILNRLPQIMTLRPPSRTTQITYANGVTTITTNVGPRQVSFLLRALYFVFVGWWLTAFWLILAWLFVALTPITLGMSLVPAFMMFDRVPQVLTLREN